MAELDVTFTDDIPKIEREGFTRSSKYTPLLDACVERPGKAARITVETQGQASSRASSIKDAAEKHSKTREGEGHFIVATRSGDAENEFHVFVQYNTGPAPSEDEAEDEVGEETEEGEETQVAKPKKKKAKAKKAKSS